MAESAVAPETHEFQAETKALLGLMINSLYTNREVFLRELISNASDALDKIRLRSLTEHDILGEDKELEVVLTPDAEAGTLTISDNGVGMRRDDLHANLGTIARSGSREFLQQLTGDAKKDANLIGQFGVGFYSAFLVSERVEVVTRLAGEEQAWRWSSSGDGTYTVSEAERERRGTDVILHLGEEQKEFAQATRIRHLITKYSDFVGYPIKLVEERTEGEGEGEEAQTSTTTEVINQGKALWTRPKGEITEDQYKEFYKHVSHDWNEPLTWTHFQVEGHTMFTGLLYLPTQAPFDMMMPDRTRRGLRLYVKRVFVMDDCEDLVPEYLRFVRGIVDSDDLPLNVSRELLQQEQVVELIKRQVTKKTLESLESLALDRPEDYATFWREFGAVLKEGLHTDFSNKDRLTKLLRYESTHAEGLTSLSEYVGRVKEGQQAIYYITGSDKDFLSKSPHIEGLRSKGYEVLYFVDPIDEWIADTVGEFEGKKLVSATKGEMKLDEEKEGEEPEEKKDETPHQWKPLVEAMRSALGDKVKDVRMTDRLTDSPVCLVTGESDLSANLERLLRAHNRPVPDQKRTLELNGSHPLIQNLRNLAGEDKYRLRFNEWSEVLYDQALLTEGSSIADPAQFAQRMTRLLLEASQRELGEEPTSAG